MVDNLEIAFQWKLNFIIRECAEILGVSSKLPNNAHDAKHVLEYVFAHIVEFKKLNQELYDDDEQYMWLRLMEMEINYFGSLNITSTEDLGLTTLFLFS